MYVCQCVRLLIPFVVAASHLTISLSVLCILLEDCRRLSGFDPFDNRILKPQNAVTKGVENTHIHFVCVCVFVCGCMVGGIEGD